MIDMISSTVPLITMLELLLEKDCEAYGLGDLLVRFYHFLNLSLSQESFIWYS